MQEIAKLFIGVYHDELTELEIDIFNILKEAKLLSVDEDGEIIGG